MILQFDISKRAFSTWNNKEERDFTKAREKENINPNWITGFIDGEGCFIIAILPSTGNKKKISLRLSVTQKSHSVGVLYDLKNLFGCGEIFSSSKDCMRFVVQRKEDILNKIIPHFTNFPLVTSKELNFETFKEAAMIVARGEHLNSIGLDKIISLKALMNKNRSFEELFNHFLDKKIKLNPYWVTGFIEAEGCFGILLTKSDKTGKISIRNRLSISQSTHDFAVLKAIKDFFNAGYLSPKAEDINSLDLAKLSQDNSFYYNSTPSTFIPFFDKYPLYTRKQLDYQDFIKFYQLKKNKVHLTDTGFEIMDNLCRNMNSGRDNTEKSRRK